MKVTVLFVPGVTSNVREPDCILNLVQAYVAFFWVLSPLRFKGFANLDERIPYLLRCEYRGVHVTKGSSTMLEHAASKEKKMRETLPGGCLV